MKQASDFEPRVIKLMEASIATKQDLLHSSALVSVVAKVSEVLIRALQQGNKALLFGNGGSAQAIVDIVENLWEGTHESIESALFQRAQRADRIRADSV